MFGRTLFHILQEQNISLYVFVSTNAVLHKAELRTTIQMTKVTKRHLWQSAPISAFCYLSGNIKKPSSERKGDHEVVEGALGFEVASVCSHG